MEGPGIERSTLWGGGRWVCPDPFSATCWAVADLPARLTQRCSPHRYGGGAPKSVDAGRRGRNAVAVRDPQWSDSGTAGSTVAEGAKGSPRLVVVFRLWQ
jgi:hypothetical protein